MEIIGQLDVPAGLPQEKFLLPIELGEPQSLTGNYWRI